MLVGAVLGGILAWPAKPLILGYVAGGVFISLLTPGPSVSDIHTVELFAEIGVVLLMSPSASNYRCAILLRGKAHGDVGADR